MMSTYLCRTISVIVGSILFALNASAAPKPDDKTHTNLLGLWEENGVTVHAISLRKPDGKYRRKILQLYDYAQPPIRYQEEGHWMVNGKNYVFTADRITAPRWLQILSCDAKLFRYLSTDGAVIEERKIGKGSDAAFDTQELPKKLKH